MCSGRVSSSCSTSNSYYEIVSLKIFTGNFNIISYQLNIKKTIETNSNLHRLVTFIVLYIERVSHVAALGFPYPTRTSIKKYNILHSDYPYYFYMLKYSINKKTKTTCREKSTKA